jgi:hypothetical protein
MTEHRITQALNLLPGDLVVVGRIAWFVIEVFDNYTTKSLMYVDTEAPKYITWDYTMVVNARCAVYRAGQCVYNA